MEFYDVLPEVVTMINKLHKNNEISVMTNGLQSNWVRIESRVKQGSEMFGFLFLLVLDWVMKNSLQRKSTGIGWKFKTSWKISKTLMILHSYPASSMTYRTKQQQ